MTIYSDGNANRPVDMDGVGIPFPSFRAIWSGVIKKAGMNNTHTRLFKLRY